MEIQERDDAGVDIINDGVREAAQDFGEGATTSQSDMEEDQEKGPIWVVPFSKISQDPDSDDDGDDDVDDDGDDDDQRIYEVEDEDQRIEDDEVENDDLRIVNGEFGDHDQRIMNDEVEDHDQRIVEDEVEDHDQRIVNDEVEDDDHQRIVNDEVEDDDYQRIKEDDVEDDLLPFYHSEGEPDQVLQIVEYCVICADIANYFDLNGTMIKREATPYSLENSAQQLLTTFCESLGIPEDNEVFKIWNLESFSICSSCEHNLYQMAMDEDVQMKTSDYIMRKIEDAEEKFVNQDLYRQHDKRYFCLRKLILGDRFKGQIPEEGVDDEDDEHADMDFVINDAETGQISEWILPAVPPKPSSHNLRITLKAQTEGNMKMQRNSTEENDQIESSETETVSQTAITDSAATSSSSNTVAQNEENIPPPNVFLNQKTKEKSKIPRFSMELRPRWTSFINFTPPNTTLSENSGGKLGEGPEHTLPSSPIDGRNLNETEGESTNKIRRKRGRPRKNDCVVAKKFKRSPSSFTDISNMMVTEGTKMVGRKRGRPRKNVCVVPALKRRNPSTFTDLSNSVVDERIKVEGRKRGRPRKYDCEVTKTLKRSVTDVNNWKRQKVDETVGRKRGRPRKTGHEIVKKYKKTSMKTVKKAARVTTNNENKESSTGEVYSKVDMIHDPLTRNIYYRTLMFVRLEDSKCFQCSTCSKYIPYCKDKKNLQQKFYIHYLIVHSDCFQCQYCVYDNRLNSPYELAHHTSIFHPLAVPRTEVKLEKARNCIKNPRPRRFVV